MEGLQEKEVFGKIRLLKIPVDITMTQRQDSIIFKAGIMIRCSAGLSMQTTIQVQEPILAVTICMRIARIIL